MLKPGWKTTEFGALVALVVVTVAAMLTDSEYTRELLDALTFAVPGYALSRGVAKRDTPTLPPEDVPAR